MQLPVAQLALMVFADLGSAAWVPVSDMAFACTFSEFWLAGARAATSRGWFACGVIGYFTTTAQGKTIYEGVNTLFCCKTVASMAPPATPVLTF